MSSHRSHIGCDEGVVGSVACWTREDRNTTRFRRIRRRGGNWNGRADMGFGVGVDVGARDCRTSEPRAISTNMGSILNSVDNQGSSIACIPQQEEVPGQSTPTVLSYQFPLSPRYFRTGRNIRRAEALNGSVGSEPLFNRRVFLHETINND
jgi:hypothetical protein